MYVRSEELVVDGPVNLVGDWSESTRGTAKSRLLRSAAMLFWSRGYAATSMSDIIAAADSSSGNLYNHFPGKEALLVAVLEEYEERMVREVVEASRDIHPDPLERIEFIVDRFRETLRSTDFKLACPLGRLTSEVVGTDDAQARMARAFSALRAEVGRCLETSSAVLRPGVRAEEASILVVAILEGALIQAQAARDLGPLDVCKRYMRSFLSESILDFSSELAGTRAG